jgi:hypothetical protein
MLAFSHTSFITHLSYCLRQQLIQQKRAKQEAQQQTEARGGGGGGAICEKRASKRQAAAGVAAVTAAAAALHSEDGGEGSDEDYDAGAGVSSGDPVRDARRLKRCLIALLTCRRAACPCDRMFVR